MNKIKLFASALSIMAVYSACNQTQESTEAPKADSVIVSAPMAIELKDADSDRAYDQYLHLKDVLVLSDSIQAQTAAKDLAVTLRKINGCENTAIMAEKIASGSSLKDQRVNFTSLSADLIDMFKHAEIASGSMFVQYCPMANDGDGGYWLASETEIRNPYYGDEMLNCGEVKETITKK
ncbi:Protein of unknown function [Daejeonella rubra]|uniref:DUF3347 domain-containing protein n=1 Tax=Daejeonella rubra TaxID=990371 RepID=A0A1G9S902_9SPHI|nr:DUF3347 domain-containing protein [Daejeonella rubra]SDM31851.1 Protein of unknown function [Daejeonella rubra]